eukprot:6218098-Heterocapsa_arctica.AAC.1
MKKQEEETEDEDRHRHKRRKIDVDVREIYVHDEEHLIMGRNTNRQARKRAEEIQAEVNNNNRKNIEAHEKNEQFEVPIIVNLVKNDFTDEQINHSYFNVKE